MKKNLRVRRTALALCAGGAIGAVGLVAAPGHALAATSCSDIYGSGSTVQSKIQQSSFAVNAPANGAFTSACTNTPAINYNNGAIGGTGSGAGLTEFALQAASGSSPAVLTSSKSSNGSFLDGFIGTDDPPRQYELQHAEAPSGSHAEVVPVVDAPVAIIVNLPAGCRATKSPVFRNVDLSNAFAASSFTGTNVTWQLLLSDAGAAPTGCTNAGKPIVQVRSDPSGTSYALKQYLSQIDPANWKPSAPPYYVTDDEVWPGPVRTTYNGDTPDKGSDGEAAAVANTVGSIGYVNTADAAAAVKPDGTTRAFNDWKSGAQTFWSKVQNNGVSTTGTNSGAEPETTALKGNCTTAISGTQPSGDEADWYGVHAANPKTASHYPLCTLTYDVAWASYGAVNLNNTLSPGDIYTGRYPGETPSGVAASVRSYLTWIVGSGSTQGQSTLPSYYSSLPSTTRTAAQKIVSTYVGKS